MEGHRNRRLLAIPHSRSLCDLSRNAENPHDPPVKLPARRPRPAAQYDRAGGAGRPLSFCPAHGYGDVAPPSSLRRFSEVSPLNGYEKRSDDWSCPLTPYPHSSSSGTLFTATADSFQKHDKTSKADTPRVSGIATADSDGRSSIYDCSAFDFPEPPPIASPVIRRMRSQPWLFQNERDALGMSLAIGNPPLTRCSVDQELVRRPLGLYGVEERQIQRANMQLVGEAFLSLDRDFDMKNRRRSTTALPDNSQRLWGGRDTVNRPIVGTMTSAVDRKQAESGERTAPLGRLPRIIRKVASMRSDSQDRPLSNNTKGPLGQKTLPKVRSFRSILRGSDAVGGFGVEYGYADKDKKDITSRLMRHDDKAAKRQSAALGPRKHPFSLVTEGVPGVSEVPYRDAMSERNRPGDRFRDENGGHSFIDLGPDGARRKREGKPIVAKKERMKGLFAKLKLQWKRRD